MSNAIPISKTLHRRALIKRAAIAGMLTACAAPAVHAQPAVRWRLASSFPKSLDTIYGGAEIFATHLKTVSGGKFEVSVHAAGELTPAFGVVDAVQRGTVEAVHTAPYYFSDKNDTFAMGGGYSFWFEQPPDERLDVSRQWPEAHA